MPKLVHRNPAYCKHKASGQAIVTIDGQDVYLGPHGTTASRREYDRIIGEWLANGRRLPTQKPGAAPADTAVVELVNAYWKFARVYYKRESGEAGDLDCIRSLLRLLKDLYGRTNAGDFGPLRAKALREKMVAAGWSRSYVNAQMQRLRRVFRWGVENEMVPPSVAQGLQAVAALRKGKTEARETDPVKPVPDAAIDAVLPHLSRQVRAMVELQAITGMRPHEVCELRTGDIDRAASPWVYAPRRHKTEHHGHERAVYFGPKAQAIVTPFLKLDPDAFIFSPIDAEGERRQAAREARKTPDSCGNVPGSNRIRRSPRRAPGAGYTPDSYRRAVERACDDAFPPPDHLSRQRVAGNGRKRTTKRWETAKEWRARLGDRGRAELAEWQDGHRWNPHQLRHTAGTRFRETHGLEGAQVLLGQKTIKVTELYAEKNLAAARRIASEVG